MKKENFKAMFQEMRIAVGIFPDEEINPFLKRIELFFLRDDKQDRDRDSVLATFLRFLKSPSGEVYLNRAFEDLIDEIRSNEGSFFCSLNEQGNINEKNGERFFFIFATKIRCTV